jgi:mRNA deadenylase 3'-5' endonuclease subunit Ccr4
VDNPIAALGIGGGMIARMPGVRVASYNVLADAYINPRFYPRTPPAVLDPALRRPALVRRVVALDADVACLQEVETAALDAIAEELVPRGYLAHFAQKTRKPDGCAIFVRAAALSVQREEIVRFADGGGDGADSGHIALVLVLERSVVGGDTPHAKELLGIATTHLKWDPPGTPRDQQRSLRQAAQLIDVIRGRSARCPSWIVCGDLNAPDTADALRALADSGLEDLYGDRPDASTCNSNGKAKRIDYLLHTRDLSTRPGELPSIDDLTPLPSSTEPSDHLPIVGWFTASASNTSA